MTDERAATFRLEQVDYLDDRAVAMRAVMDQDMVERYAVPGRELFPPEIAAVLAIDPADIVATVLVVDADGAAVGHGALRMLRGDWEVKRIIVDGAQRGHGLGRRIMLELERIAREQGAPRLILQTGDKQPEAVGLYVGLGYTPIPVYEPYIRAIPNSLCFEKPLT
jgi:GNAT superfamily N-acetyltransferase